MPALVGVGDRVKPDIAEARLALADDDGCAIDQDAVDQIFAQKSGRRCRSALDQQVVDVMKSIDIARILQGFPTIDGVAASKQSAPRRGMLKAREAHIEPRLIGEIGAAPDQDHIASRALEMNMGAGVLASDPLRFARWQRDLAVDRERALQRDPRAAEPQPREPPRERALPRLAPDAARHFNRRAPQPPD